MTRGQLSSFDGLDAECAAMDSALKHGEHPMEFQSIQARKRFQLACYRARALDRRQTLHTYPEGDERRDRTPWAILSFTSPSPTRLLIRRKDHPAVAPI